MIRVNIYRIPFGYFNRKDTDFNITKQGYLESENFNSEECYNICNWSCALVAKPETLHSDILYCNSDIIFEDTSTGTFHICLPKGWKVVNSLEEVKSFCIANEGKGFDIT